VHIRRSQASPFLGYVNKIGIISGLKRELRCLGLGFDRPGHVVTFAAAGSPERAHARARGWIADGRVRALMSFGLCGGLDPALAPGTVLVSHQIKMPEGHTLRFDERWARAIAARIPHARVAPLLGVDTAAVTAEDKRALYAKHAVPALDMESRGVAEAAHEAKIPFVAIRAVADPAGRTLPSAALNAINAHGRLRPLRVLLELLRRPRDFAALLALASDARRGYDALAAATPGALLADLIPHFGAAAHDAGLLLPEFVPQGSRA
jgi:adenosylhomocysteine nucleosidase